MKTKTKIAPYNELVVKSFMSVIIKMFPFPVFLEYYMSDDWVGCYEVIEDNSKRAPELVITYNKAFEMIVSQLN